jgi:hypothetical protein
MTILNPVEAEQLIIRKLQTYLEQNERSNTPRIYPSNIDPEYIPELLSRTLSSIKKGARHWHSGALSDRKASM